MEDDDRAEIARQGLEAIERADPAAIRARLEQTAQRAAGDAVLGGIAKISRLAGVGARRPRHGPSAETVERTLAAMEAQSVAAFDEQLAAAALRAQQAEEDDEEAEAADLARLRRSFPPESRELAILVFACVDLLEDLVDRDQPASAEELARKEALLARIGALLAPRAESALASFVDHVTALSARHRTR
ncbi:MAG: hypothetical protein M3Y87_25250 [Myxococcota bacterium]|nr:hypothetical protein [Myxococcota bacterium]